MTRRVLIVDDKDDNLYFLDALLSGNGFAVTQARHGAEALVLARQNTPDLIVSDLLMPVMDGYTLLRHWKADPALRQVPFIVYTATYTEPSDERLALDLGADAFMLKPSEPDELLRRIRAVLEAGTVAPPREQRPDDDALLGTYRSALIRKLEEKSMQLSATNAALAKAMEQHTRILDSVVEGIAGLDAAGRIEFINKAGAELTGWTERELIGREMHATMHHHYADGHVYPSDECPITRTLRDGEVRRSRDEIFFRRDGTSFSVECVVSPIRAISGDLSGAVVAFRDITERKRAETLLREQAALLDQAQDAIIVRSLDHTIRFWNRGAERMYGWTSAEVLDKSIMTMLDDDPTEFTKATSAVLESGEWVGEIQQRTREGKSLTVEGRWTLLRRENGTPYAIMAINTDITTRKQLEQQFLRAQRMESIGTLAGGIAHDLNNVLAPIMMSIEVLQDSITDADGREMLELIAKSAKRGADMVAQVLSFGRGLESRRVQLHPSAVIREVLTIAGETFPKQIAITTELTNDLWPIEADPTQLHQVLLNLCVNARDAMPNGGSLTISGENTYIDELGAAMNIEAHAGPYVILRIADTGAGIAESNMDRIFDPFFTTKELGKGTGLGLATSLAIVKNHRGFIRVRSQVDRGTEFSIYLPALGAQNAVESLSTSSALPSGRGELVLVVDDEVAIREVTRHVLEAHGYRVLTAADGSEAVTVYLKHKAQVQLVLTDMMMPNMDGLTTIEVLRRMEPGIRIVGASGLGRPDPAGKNPSTALRHFLVKPFDAPTLLRTVRDALDE